MSHFTGERMEAWGSQLTHLPAELSCGQSGEAGIWIQENQVQSSQPAQHPTLWVPDFLPFLCSHFSCFLQDLPERPAMAGGLTCSSAGYNCCLLSSPLACCAVQWCTWASLATRVQPPTGLGPCLEHPWQQVDCVLQTEGYLLNILSWLLRGQTQDLMWGE